MNKTIKNRIVKRMLCILMTTAMLMSSVEITAFAAESETLMETSDMSNEEKLTAETDESGNLIEDELQASDEAEKSNETETSDEAEIAGEAEASEDTETSDETESSSEIEVHNETETIDGTEASVNCTTFTFNGSTVTVVEGGDKQYEVAIYNDKDEESAAAQSIGEDGSITYSVPDEVDGELLVSITKNGGSYIFQGSGNGSIAVKKGAKNDAILYLNGLTLTSSFTSVITVKKESTATCTIYAMEGTTNILTDNVYNSDEENNIAAEKAVMKFKDDSDVIIKGSGTIEIKANAKNGIKANNKLAIDEDVTINIDAVDNGISSENSITINSGTISIKTGEGDGIKACADNSETGDITIAGGNITIDAYADGIQAMKNLTISGGIFDIKTYNGYDDASYDKDDDSYPSAKGLKASGSYVSTDTKTEVDATDCDLTITGGTFTINSSDDAIHSDTSVTITGGDFNIKTKDDGIHGDYFTTIGNNRGNDEDLNIKIENSYEGIEGAEINLYSGTCKIFSSDDCINAANSDLTSYDFELNIYGGNIYASTTEGDCIDSNNNINIYGGTVVALGAINANDNNALDCDGKMIIEGGTVLAVARYNQMENVPSSGSQPYVTWYSGGYTSTAVTATSSGNSPGGSSSPGGTFPGSGNAPGSGGPGGNEGGSNAPGGNNPGGSSNTISIANGKTVSVYDGSDTSGTKLFSTVVTWDTTTNNTANYVLFTTDADNFVSGNSYTLKIDETTSEEQPDDSTGGGNSGGSSDEDSDNDPPDKKPDDDSDNEYGDVIPEDIPSDGKIPEGLWMAFVENAGVYYYTGSAIKPEVRVYDYKTLLEEKTDYKITYKNNSRVNDASVLSKAPTITVTGKGNYTGKDTKTFKILSLDISSENGDNIFESDDISIVYNGKAQKPVPVILWNGKKLKNKTDYVITYHEGSYENTYTNNDNDDNNITDTKELKTVKDVGNYYIKLVGIGNFTGTRRIKLTVLSKATDASALKSISKASVTKIPSQSYQTQNKDGAVTPEVTVKDGIALTKDVHYTVTYSNNTKVGTAYAIIKGIEEGGYSGTKRVSFIITGVAISKATVNGLSGKTFIYDGTDIEPELTLSAKVNGTVTPLIKDTDYSVKWQKNQNAGTATVIFTGKNGYTGTLKKTFKINAYNIAENKGGLFKAEITNVSVPYAKGGAKPELNVTFLKSGTTQTLEEGTDYTVTYKNNKELNNGSSTAKLPTVIIKGKGNFTGTYSENLTYKIIAQDLSKLKLTAVDKVYQNKNNIYTTKITITDLDGQILRAGTDYDKNLTYTYKKDTPLDNGTMRREGTVVDKNDIIPAGTVINVTATPKGNYAGEALSGEYSITTYDISKAKVTVPKQIYTGREIKLDKTDGNQILVKVKGQKVNSDQYEIVGYTNNVKKGTAAVTIKGVGNYGGTKTVKFKITAKKFLWF